MDNEEPKKKDQAKEKIILFVIGVLVGAVISTGAFFAYIKLAGISANNNQSMQMPGQGGTPPEMPSQGGTPPEMPNSNQGEAPSEMPSDENNSNNNQDTQNNQGNASRQNKNNKSQKING